MNEKYFIRKFLVAVVVALIAGFVSKSVLTGVIVGLLPLILMLAMYPVRKERINSSGRVAADEREIQLDYKAARYSWAFICIGLGLTIMYFDIYMQQGLVPIETLSSLLWLGVGIYLGLKYWFKRA